MGARGRDSGRTHVREPVGHSVRANARARRHHRLRPSPVRAGLPGGRRSGRRCRVRGCWSTGRARRFSNAAMAAVAVGALALAGLAAPWIYGAKVQQRWWPPYALNLRAARSDRGGRLRAHAIRPLASRFSRRGRTPSPRSWRSRSGAPTCRARACIACSAARPRRRPRARARRTRRSAPSTSFDQLKAFGARTGVSWYIADTPGDPAAGRPAVTSRCVYCGATVQVYDLR